MTHRVKNANAGRPRNGSPGSRGKNSKERRMVIAGYRWRRMLIAGYPLAEVVGKGVP
jgi:hypothetical protein